MDEKSAQSPWEQLSRTQDEIPWSALETFADAVVTKAGLTEELFKTYEQARTISLDQTCYADLYVPAIFALAAPKLTEDQRRTIGEFLVKKLAEAGQDDDDVMMEVLLGACGSMGPVVMPAVLDAIAGEPDAYGAWFHLWDLTALAAQAQDAVIRDRAVKACAGLLEQIDRGEAEDDEGIGAAWTLAVLGRTEYVDLLQQLSGKCARLFGGADYENAANRLRGVIDPDRLPEMWERPVQEWFKPRWQTVRDWFARRASQEMEDARADAAAADSILRRFVRSAWAADLPQDLREDAPFIISGVLEYAQSYEGVAPSELDEPTLRTVLLNVFAHRITGERSFFAKAAPVVATFLDWMAAEGIVADGAALSQAVRNWGEEIVAAGMNPANWGPAKREMMKAKRAGVDAADAEALRTFWYEQALESLEEEEDGPDEVDAPARMTPIVEQSPKVGRNDPCPCGSGRKYKKCCGNPAKDQAAKT
jgi:hypothetical protein